MARWFLIVMAIAFFVCLSQIVEAQEEPNTNKIKEELNKLYETVKQGFENISKDPNVQDLVKHGQEFVQKVQQEASKLIPKTDETASPAA